MRKIFLLFVLFAVASGLCDDEDSSTKGSSALKVTELPHSYSAKAKFGFKMFAVFLHYCGSDPIPEEQLVAVENCSYKRTLDQETVKKCDEESYGGQKTLNERRKIRCFKKTRNESGKKFAMCYVRENPESAGDQKLKYDEFSTLTKQEKQKVIKDTFRSYAACVARALKMETS